MGTTNALNGLRAELSITNGRLESLEGVHLHLSVAVIGVLAMQESSAQSIGCFMLQGTYVYTYGLDKALMTSCRYERKAHLSRLLSAHPPGPHRGAFTNWCCSSAIFFAVSRLQSPLHVDSAHLYPSKAEYTTYAGRHFARPANPQGPG